MHASRPQQASICISIECFSKMNQERLFVTHQRYSRRTSRQRTIYQPRWRIENTTLSINGSDSFPLMEFGSLMPRRNPGVGIVQ
ncbi:hypothetical protein TNCV_3339861 [Trichonephila clavipes]|nr:hypothetical protein TNCV_3339861 [Trichonephila clavipes]